MTRPLQRPESIHLDAAKGWCALEAFLEANDELEKISPKLRAHPDVLEVRWQIYANLGKWDGALELASTIMALVPGEPKGYIYTASTLHELGRLEEALQTLLDAVKKFPSDEIILYDLASIACSMRRMVEASAWLAKAIEVGGDPIKLKALDDPNLDPIWKGVSRSS